MEQFIRVSGIAAPLMQANIDTDLLIPSREITHAGREGFGEKLLAPWRYTTAADGSRVEKPDFVLNREPFRHAVVLLAGPNFGSGSSREAAVWAVRGFGLRCVIAPSFGAIFRNNCLRNGVLPVQLPLAQVQALAAQAEAGTLELTVDLEQCAIVRADGSHIGFEIDATARTLMLEGLDDIGITLKRRDEIEAFQRRDRETRPWIWQFEPKP